VCTSLPVICTDGNVCNGVESCDPGTGTCLSGAALVCDDANICTDDSCDPLLGCQYLDNTAPCDDADACSSGDVCSVGECSGTPDLMCAISALEAVVEGANAGDLGGGRRQRKLIRLVLKLRTRTERGLLGDPAKAARQFKKANKAAARIASRTTKGVNTGKVEPTVGDLIIDLTEPIQSVLHTLMGFP
jgi:hypothetical protein